MEEFVYNNRRYEIVDKVPKGYIIWNIGHHNMKDGYLPLCELVSKYDINPATLKAIKVEGSKEILDVVSYGYCGRTAVRKMYSDLTLHRCTRLQRERILNALPYMKKLVWE